MKKNLSMLLLIFTIAACAVSARETMIGAGFRRHCIMDSEGPVNYRFTLNEVGLLVASFRGNKIGLVSSFGAYLPFSVVIGASNGSESVETERLPINAGLQFAFNYFVGPGYQLHINEDQSLMISAGVATEMTGIEVLTLWMDIGIGLSIEYRKKLQHNMRWCFGLAAYYGVYDLATGVDAMDFSSNEYAYTHDGSLTISPYVGLSFTKLRYRPQ